MAATKKYGLLLRRNTKQEFMHSSFQITGIEASSDEYWAQNDNDSYSIAVLYAAYNGMPLAWILRKQQAVVLLTAKNEYQVVIDMIQPPIYVRQDNHSTEHKNT